MIEDDDYYVQEEEFTNTPGWTPSVSLQVDDVIATGEEDEEEVFSQRSKLYRFMDGEWKERGLGPAKLLKHKETGKTRFMMRQEKTEKIVADHIVLDCKPYSDLQPNAGSEKCWEWTSQDFAEDDNPVEQFALKFGTKELTEKFKEAFDKAKTDNAEAPSKACDVISIAIPSDDVSDVASDESRSLTSSMWLSPAESLASTSAGGSLIGSLSPLPSPREDLHANLDQTLQDFWGFFKRSEGADVMQYTYLAPGRDRFAALLQNSAYYVPHAESRTLAEHARTIAAYIHGLPSQPRIVEWGPGPAKMVELKTLPILQELVKSGSISYEAVDVKRDYALDASDLVAASFGSQVTATASSETDFVDHALAELPDDSTCMLCWGVTFGNFDGPGRQRLLSAIKKYGMAIFSVDHNLDPDSLLAAYNIPEEHDIVMGAFEYFSLLQSKNKDLSGFEIDAWTSEFSVEVVHKNEAGIVDEVRVVGYIQNHRSQTLHFPGDTQGQRHQEIPSGSRFQVFRSHRLSEDRIRKVLEEAPCVERKEVIATGIFGEGSSIGLVVVGSPSAKEDLEKEPDILSLPCLTCGQVLRFPRVGGNADYLPEYMAHVQEHGRWRQGSYLYMPCKNCDQRHVRLDLMKARANYLDDKGNFRGKKLDSVGKAAYKATHLEYLPLSLPDVFHEVYGLYKRYQAASPHVLAMSEAEIRDSICNSVLGSVSEEILALLNTGKFHEIPAGSAVGSCFVRFFVGGAQQAVMMVDLLGSEGLSGKHLWYEPECIYTSSTRAIAYKTMEIGYRLDLPFLYMSIFDPANVHLKWKTSFFPYCEVQMPGSFTWKIAGEEVLPDGTWKTAKCAKCE